MFGLFGRKKVSLTGVVRVCPGGRHAWFASNVGVIRKPINEADC